MKNLVSTNPFTQQTIKSYPQSTDLEVKKSLDSAEKRFLKWREVPLSEKLLLFKNLSSVIKTEKDILARLATDEMGKPYAQAIAEVEKCALTCEYYAENAEHFLNPKEIKTDADESLICYQPLGCILAVMPWNFPYWQVLRFSIPTMIAGNVVVLKHASNVSGCALKIEELFLKAGFPPNAFKTFLLSSDRIKDLISDSRIRGVSLTGSTEAGKKVAEVAGRYLKKLVLELGGSDPYLVLEDADVGLAAEVCMKSRLQNNGQSCIAAKRFIVHEKVYDSFKEHILKIAKEVKTGDPADRSVNLGPIARFDLKKELASQVEAAINEGAEIFYQGKLQSNDCFYPVTIIENVSNKNSAYKQEFFGPVLMLFKVSSDEEAIEIANGTSYGLGSAIFSKDISKAKNIAMTKLNAGNSFVNAMVKSDPRLPFGGIYESGYGRELSHHGLLEFVNIKSVSIQF